MKIYLNFFYNLFSSLNVGRDDRVCPNSISNSSVNIIITRSILRAKKYIKMGNYHNQLYILNLYNLKERELFKLRSDNL